MIENMWTTKKLILNVERKSKAQQVQPMTGHSFGYHPTKNVPFMIKRGKTLQIYLHLQIAETKYSNDATPFLGLKIAIWPQEGPIQ